MSRSCHCANRPKVPPVDGMEGSTTAKPPAVSSNRPKSSKASPAESKTAKIQERDRASKLNTKDDRELPDNAIESAPTSSASSTKHPTSGEAKTLGRPIGSPSKKVFSRPAEVEPEGENVAEGIGNDPGSPEVRETNLRPEASSTERSSPPLVAPVPENTAMAKTKVLRPEPPSTKRSSSPLAVPIPKSTVIAETQRASANEGENVADGTGNDPEPPNLSETNVPRPEPTSTEPSSSPLAAPVPENMVMAETQKASSDGKTSPRTPMDKLEPGTPDEKHDRESGRQASKVVTTEMSESAEASSSDVQALSPPAFSFNASASTFHPRNASQPRYEKSLLGNKRKYVDDGPVPDYVTHEDGRSPHPAPSEKIDDGSVEDVAKERIDVVGTGRSEPDKEESKGFKSLEGVQSSQTPPVLDEDASILGKDEKSAPGITDPKPSSPADSPDEATSLRPGHESPKPSPTTSRRCPRNSCTRAFIVTFFIAILLFIGNSFLNQPMAQVSDPPRSPAYPNTSICVPARPLLPPFFQLRFFNIDSNNAEQHDQLLSICNLPLPSPENSAQQALSQAHTVLRASCGKIPGEMKTLWFSSTRSSEDSGSDSRMSLIELWDLYGEGEQSDECFEGLVASMRWVELGECLRMGVSRCGEVDEFAGDEDNKF